MLPAARRDLYIGVSELDGLVFRRGSEACHLEFELPGEIGEIAEAYLIFRYEVVELCCCDPVYAAHTADHAPPSLRLAAAAKSDNSQLFGEHKIDPPDLGVLKELRPSDMRMVA